MLRLELRRVKDLKLARAPFMLVQGECHNPIVDTEASRLTGGVISRSCEGVPQAYLDVIQASDTNSILWMFVAIHPYCSAATPTRIWN